MKTRHWRTILVWFTLTLAIAGLCGLCTILYIDRWMERRSRGRVHRSGDQIPAAEVALILGARVFSNRQPSAMLEDRIRGGVDLYKAGKVKKLLMSGDNRESHYDEVTVMRRRAIELGVPPDDVVRDFAGFRTLDSIYRARDLWGQKKLIIVSQQFHLPRSIFLADALGVDAYGLIADRRNYTTIRKSRFREVLARSSAWIDIKLLGTKPRFLGRKEHLSGIKQEAEERI